MATRSIPFNFLVTGESPEDFFKMTAYHDLPAALIREDGLKLLENDANYAQFLTSTTCPFLQSYSAHLLQNSKKHCFCGQPSVRVIQNPVPFLHEVQSPSMEIVGIPYCGKTECEMLISQNVGLAVREVDKLGGVKDTDENGVPLKTKVASCRVCGKVEGAMFCKRCKMIAYCGKECQKKDWDNHKRPCAALANRKTAVIDSQVKNWTSTK